MTDRDQGRRREDIVTCFRKAPAFRHGALCIDHRFGRVLLATAALLALAALAGKK